MSYTIPNPLLSIARRTRNAFAISIGVTLVAACAGASLSTQVLGTWNDAKYANDPQRPGPTLPEAIKAAGADGVLLVDVRAIGSYEPYTIGQTITSLSPDTMASYSYLKKEGADQKGDYKVAHIVSELYLPSMGK